MTVRFKKVRDFDRLSMISEFENDLIKDDLDDIYVIDEREADVDPDDIMEQGFMQGFMSA